MARQLRQLIGALIAALCVLLVGTDANAQVPGAGPRTGRAAALNDLTGYWVSVVTEDWRIRMLVPDPRDYLTLPLNLEASKAADAWDPAKETAGEECKSYGAPAILRIPGRLHIDWQDDNTLRIDIDSGTQTRLLRFAGTPPPNATPDWQGYSAAAWIGQRPISTAGGGRPPSQGTLPGRQSNLDRRQDVEPGQGQLRVLTTNLRPGYLRKNGVPYSGRTTVEEYFDRFTAPNGDTFLVVTIVVTDPQYLVEPYITHAHFKKIPDRSGWDPTPCRVDQPR